MRKPNPLPGIAIRSVARVSVACVAIAALALTSCSPEKKKTSAPPPSKGVTAASCVTNQKVALTKPGVLTIATDSPAYEPWFKNNQPANGKGFEGAVAYAVARKLGFGAAKVRWVKEAFNNSYAPGKKDFDFDINQISITPARAKKVDFSTGYYVAAQAIVVLKKSKYAKAKNFAELKSATIGAQVGTTSLTAAQQEIAPSKKVQIYDDTTAATQALKNGQLDGLVVDLPTAFYITAAEMNGKGVIAGQFQSVKGTPEQFGMLFEKGSPLVGCVNLALADLRTSGTLAAIEKKWLSAAVDVPVLS
jgi:polar amino acid transport system substrate-binding protein